MASSKVTLLLLLSMTAGLGQSATVTQADEDRAIDSIMTEFLVQRQGPGRVMNVSLNADFYHSFCDTRPG